MSFTTCIKNNPILIGISGGIGSGKTTISNELQAGGYLVYNSDKEAQRIINTDKLIKQKLNELFQENVYLHNELDRKIVAEKVFSDKTLLNKMNAIVHPIVKQDVINWKNQQTDKKVVFIESAILYESGFHTLCDKILWITAPEELRISRVMQRNSVSREAVLLRIKNQISDQEGQQRSNFVINNNGKTTIKELLQNFLEWLQ